MLGVAVMSAAPDMGMLTTGQCGQHTRAGRRRVDGWVESVLRRAEVLMDAGPAVRCTWMSDKEPTDFSGPHEVRRLREQYKAKAV